ncbi:MAG TPA: 2Fe-2S iron-sulfur cluster-binding protein [Vicinamibacterales bacterium]
MTPITLVPIGEPPPTVAPTVSLTIDGVPLSAPQGTTILSACRTIDRSIPTLCYLDTLKPVNVCRLCVVEVEGSRVLAPACSRGVEAGMVVHTSSPRVMLARRLVLEMLASSVDLSTTPGMAELLVEYGCRPQRFGAGERAGATESAATVAQPVKIDNDLYVRDYAKCVLCYKCVEACGPDHQNTFAIAIAGRGFGARVSTEFDAVLPDSACVYCGNCIAVCPTGALMDVREYVLRRSGGWDESRQTTTDTICPYCGVGCTLTLHVQDGEIVKATSPFDNTITEGNLCIKGRFGWRFVSAAAAARSE